MLDELMTNFNKKKNRPRIKLLEAAEDAGKVGGVFDF